MLYKRRYLLLFHLFSLTVFGQGETANWYFGNGAGITFNNDGTVTPLTDGQLDTFEGCASISDAFGNLMLYTDGILVYDRNHNIMENGTGLYGDPSSTQSAIIVQKPDDPNILYIFTVDTKTFEEDPDFGLNYSVVDMTMNGGNGAVTQKNVNLLADCSEKISAVLKDCFNQSIWVVALGFETDEPTFFNTYYAYEINDSGVNTVPVKSTFDDLEIIDPRGYLKFSPDGSVLASANANSGLFLYDFDVTSGIFSNQQELQISDENNASYGIEFSTNQQFLYVHSSGIPNPDTPQQQSSSLIQYDLTETDIAASEVILDKRPIFRGALQMGQNGKIYRTIAQSYLVGTPFLGVIENPNEKGTAANYVHNAISLNGKNATQGLPPFVQSFFDRIELVRFPDGTTNSSLALCNGEAFTLEGDNLPGATYSWEKDGVPLVNSDYFLTIDPANISDSGRYTLKINPSDPGECPIIGEAFISVNPLPEAEPLLLVQCDAASTNSTDGITTFNLEQSIYDESFSYYFYESLTDLNADNPISNPIGYANSTPFNQTIYYKIVDNNGCEDSDELQLQVLPIVLTEDEKSYYGCDDNPEDGFLESFFDLDGILEVDYSGRDATLYASLEDASLEENPLSGEFLTSSTTIYARIEDNNACEDVDRINLVVNPTPSLSFNEEFVWCTDGPTLSIDAPTGFDIYRWYQRTENGLVDLGGQSTVEISSLGDYVLAVGYMYPANNEILECWNQSDFKIIPSNRATIENIEVQDISDNNIVEIFVYGDGDYEYSLDGTNYQDVSIFENVEPGFVTVAVRDKNGCGITKRMISVIGYPKFFTPNGDNYNDTWQIIGVDGQFQAESIIQIFDRYGKLMAQISPTTNGWDGTFNNNELPASDYWFKVALEDGRIFKGHFALKR
ncbi:MULTISPECIES: T9SS type B sorting domain-containing protein [Flavobacteriaceae]|uniref:T9SS type B sorting domain-containing protein n=1 Tax=Flavobacteriaceae TaxID=49546 RepID=UPI00149138CE|nr:MULTISPECIES: T9SS type B sorting domain-containing protein [Allomuricauda]MDC6367435.1 T9SS type B sorting domain-containing protein [Muricauda sp. AC10]